MAVPMEMALDGKGVDKMETEECEKSLIDRVACESVRSVSPARVAGVFW